MEDPQSYPLIIGEHGTGKTSLIKLALERMKAPKGVIYVDMPYNIQRPIQVVEAMQNAFGWTKDPLIDLNKDGCSDSL